MGLGFPAIFTMDSVVLLRYTSTIQKLSLAYFTSSSVTDIEFEGIC